MHHVPKTKNKRLKMIKIITKEHKSVLSILNLIASEPKTTIKEQILRDNQDNDALRRCFQFSYNKQINFGISTKTYPSISEFVYINNIDVVLDFMESKLSTREVTGNNAIGLLRDLLASTNADVYEVIRRVCNNDLEVGIGATVANKVWPDLCPKQPMMLATPEDDVLSQAIIDRGHAVAELKADGARSVCDIGLIDGDRKISFISRGGNEYLRLNKIRDSILSSNFGNWVIDGELVYIDRSVIGMTESDREEGNGIVSKSLNGTISDEQADNIVFQVWDIIPRDVYYGHRDCPPSLIFEERRKILEKFVESCDGDCIELIEQTPVDTLKKAKEIYAKYSADGYEGIILKCGLGLWENTRSKNQIKFKDKIRVDVRIVSVYPHTKDPSKLGGFTIATEDGVVKCDCGSGFSDTTHKKIKGVKTFIPLENRGELDREYLMSIADTLIDQVIEIECNGLTRNKKTKQISLFLPIMKLFRRDKSVANNIGDVFTQSAIDRVS